MAKIDALFDDLLAREGSDLHLGVGYPPMVRVQGDLAASREEPVDGVEMEELLLELLSPEQKKTITEELDLDFAYPYGDKARFRANYFYKTTGLAGVFRVIPTRVQSLAELGCPEVLWKLSDRRAGLILVTGPTGSGKSTTLAAMVDHINKTRAAHVLTIEDPIEFVHESHRSQITHREIGRDAPTFATAMRSAGREDTDVVLIGELRSNETMRLALQLASFGILVLATVHTNSAASTIERLVNSFAADEQPQVRGMLAECLVGIVAQQLLRSASGKGRIAAHEVLIGSPAVAATIRENKSVQIPSLMQSGQAQGMQTMDMALERLMAQSRITPEIALELASDKEAFGRLVARLRPDLAEQIV